MKKFIAFSAVTAIGLVLSSSPVYAQAASSAATVPIMVDRMESVPAPSPVIAAPEQIPATAYAAAPVQTERPAGMVGFREALIAAYQKNPDLLAARAELRGVDENYAEAMSGYRPVISGDVGYQSVHEKGDVNGKDKVDPKTVGLGIRQPLYRGGTTEASVRRAENRVKGQRALLKRKEQEVLLQAVTSYMDVIRDQKIVDLNRSNEGVFKKYLEEARQRFDLGDITKTDVSQAESRYANATAGVVRAEGNYRSSRAVFERVVGLSPDHLESPVIDEMIPSSLEGAISDAETNNPDVVFARFNQSATAANTRAIVGEMLPQLDVSGSVGRTYDPSNRVDEKLDSATIGLFATIPLYTSGATDARVRESRQIETQRRQELSNAERIVRQNVIDAWADLGAANAEIAAREIQIDAARIALEGVRVETEYGSRTTLDLLDAEQEYLDAQVAHVTAQRGRVVAIYTLLASVGELTAEAMKLETEIYNPLYNFQKTKNRWVGTGIKQVTPTKTAGN